MPEEPVVRIGDYQHKLTPRLISDIPLLPFQPLIGGRFIHPSDVTVLYGPGGTGKGLIAAHVSRTLLSEGLQPLILDWERHEQEWVVRLNGVRVQYLDMDWDIAAKRREIEEVISDLQINVLIIDSAFRAIPIPLPRETDAHVVRKMFAYLHGFRIPSLVITHVSKASMKDGEEPKHSANPLGSVQWTNQARLTWSAIQLPGNGNMTMVETRCMKANDRTIPPTRIWEFHHETGEARVYPRGGRAFSVSREIWNLLDKTQKAMTPAAIAVALQADFPNQVDKMGRVQIERLLWRRKDELYRKVPSGWLSIASDKLFASGDAEVEDA